MSILTEDWLTDDRGNRCSVEHFGSKEAAQAALDSLKDCYNCDNCSGCTDCSDCTGCSRCSDCSDLTSSSPTLGAQPAAPVVPIIQNIHAAVYAAASQPESLDMSSWHKCANTHCRAGWVVTLAGAEGKALEAFYDTPLAAMMIYDASDPKFKINPCRFFDDNKAALADMKRLAEERP